MNTLPPPDIDALAHSQQLAALIRAQITAQGGALPFSRFMELALYTPGLGYYSAGATKFGPAGDFITAPELGPLFSATVATALAPVLQQIGSAACFMEIGGGSGAFAEACLEHLQALDCLPHRYAILEPSADLRQRQQTRLQTRLPADMFARLEWLDGPIESEWQGVVFANEVIDALPTPRFVIGPAGEVLEECVSYNDAGDFIITEQPADALLEAAVRHLERELEAPFAPGYRSEVLPQLPYWIQAVIGRITRGALLFADYGHPRREYYAPWRDEGTLRAFRRHHQVDPLQLPGLQDITASVDFTALAEAASHAGFALSGYSNQANFLIGNGIEQQLATRMAECPDEASRLRLVHAFKQLTLPDAMGERFSLIGFEYEVDFEPAFTLGEMSWRL